MQQDFYSTLSTLWESLTLKMSNSSLVINFYSSLFGWEITLWTTLWLYHNLPLQLQEKHTLISSYEAVSVNGEPGESWGEGKGRCLQVGKFCVHVNCSLPAPPSRWKTIKCHKVVGFLKLFTVLLKYAALLYNPVYQESSLIWGRLKINTCKKHLPSYKMQFTSTNLKRIFLIFHQAFQFCTTCILYLTNSYIKECSFASGISVLGTANLVRWKDFGSMYVLVLRPFALPWDADVAVRWVFQTCKTPYDVEGSN